MLPCAQLSHGPDIVNKYPYWKYDVIICDECRKDPQLSPKVFIFQKKKTTMRCVFESQKKKKTF